MVVVLESPDDEPVCVGTGVTEVAVVSRTGLGATLDVDANAFVVVVGAPWAEKNAVYVNGVRPQPRKTVEPPLNRYFPKLGADCGL